MVRERLIICSDTVNARSSSCSMSASDNYAGGNLLVLSG
jgi:hypothetical protein